MHDSLLPAYAGFSPLIWALLDGETEVGVTAHLMNSELDAGGIVLRWSVPVGPTDTGTDLFHWTVDLIGPITIDALVLIASGRLDWPAEDIDRLIRAQSDPYPNAFTFYRGERIRIVRASVSTSRYGGTPGRVFIREGDGVVIVAGVDARRGRNHGLAIEQVRADDGSEHAATEYFRTMGGYLTSHPC